MKRNLILCITCFLILFFLKQSFAQYQINGNASNTGGGCYQLTPNTTGQVGSVWNTNLINLNNAFDFTFFVNLGCDDAGADGICFGLQPLSTNIGISGNGMGLGGVTPSLGVYIDTYQNSSPDSDPAYDHISINSDGDVDHLSTNNLAGPVQASSTNANVEDCANHTLRVKWDPITQTYQVWFDGVLRLTYVGDIINTVFGGNPNVYWGFTGSTGGLTNTQSFCIIIVANFSANTVCQGAATQFTDLSTSGTPITNWSWNFGDGTPVFSGSVAATYQNPTHTYATAGTYVVQETILNSGGGTSSISHTITVLAPPTVSASGGTTICAGQSVNLTGVVGGPSNIPVTFNSSGVNNNVSIPDGGVSFGWTGTGGSFATSKIAVSGLNAGWTFTSISLNISHTWDGDVIVYLFDPCGNSIQLINGVGSAGDNFTNTTFSPSASTSISSGAAPFNGTFVPSGGVAAWNAFITASQACGTANGNWSLRLGDDVSTDSGTLTSWSLTFSNPTTPTYVWSPTVNMTNATTLSPTVTPTVTITYTLTASNSYGCTSMATTVVTVNSNLNITVNSVTICAGQTATLTANGGTNYVWSGGSTVNPRTVTPAVTTSYTVTGSSGGCSNSAVAVVTIGGSLTISVNSPTICKGSNISLTASGASTYVWSTTATTSSINVTPASTTTYTVTGTSGGCTGTAKSIVTVNSLPTIAVNSKTICAGSSTTLTATGGTTYIWNTGATTTTINVNPLITTSYTVTGTSALGCTGTASVTVTVNPLPTVVVNSVTICPGQATSLIGTGASTYNWSNSATTTSITVTPVSNTTYTVTGSTTGCTGSTTASVIIGASISVSVNSPTICKGSNVDLTASGASTYVWSTTATTSSINVTPASTITYTVTGTSGGCTGTTKTIVTVNSLPTIAVNSATICNGQSASLTASGAFGFNWSNGFVTNPITVSPTINTTYTVTGTTSGCTGTASAKITVNSLPTISVTSLTICSGQSANLSANGATNYSWSTTETTNPLSVTPLINTTYTVTGTMSGCSGSTTASVTIGGSMTINVNSPTICLGQAATLIASGATNYVWSTGSINNPLVISPITTSSYTVTGTSGGCTGSAISTVTVNLLPTINVNSETICTGQIATITASGGTLYSWSTGSTNNIINVSSAGTYTVTGTNNGCSTTATSFVNVISIPTIVVNNSTICAGQTAILLANGATNYLWSTAETTASISVSPFSNTSYTVTGTNSGCSTTTTSSVYVNTSPTSILSGGGAVCVGAITPAVSIVLTGTAPWTITYTDGNIPITVTTSSSPYLISNPSEGMYSVTSMNDASSCPSINNGSASVVFNPLPNPDFTAGPLSGCSPLCVNFTNNPPNASGTITAWKWNFGTTVSTDSTPQHCFSAGMYNVTLTVTGTNNCSATSAPTLISVGDKPIAAFALSPNPATILDPTIIFTNQSSSDVTYWQWDFGDGAGSSNSTNPTYTYPEFANSYTATLIVHNQFNCWDTVAHDLAILNVFTFYIPNAFSPNGDGKNDTFYGVGTEIKKFEMNIFDRWGNLIFIGDDINKVWDGRANGGSEICQEGVYVWKVALTDNFGKSHQYIGNVTLVK